MVWYGIPWTFLTAHAQVTETKTGNTKQSNGKMQKKTVEEFSLLILPKKGFDLCV